MMAALEHQQVASKGVVKFYHIAKEYGFIVGDDGVERFFNSNQMRVPLLLQGDRVSFLSCQNAKGPIAYQVVLGD